MILDTIPSTPPPDLGAQVEAAAQRFDELRSRDRELRFDRDPVAHRIVVEVHDGDGNVLRRIPSGSALAIVLDGVNP